MIKGDGFELRSCRGDSCPMAVIDTENLTKKCQEVLEKANLGDFFRSLGLKKNKCYRFRVAIAACPNACTQVHIADFGVIGQAVPALVGDCNTCGSCVEVCEEEAITLFEDRFPLINTEYCVNCGACVKACPKRALQIEECGFKILAGGKLGRHPRLAEEVLAMVDKERVPKLLEKTILFYKKHCQNGERLRVVIEKLGWDSYLASLK
ncbi:nitrite and sulphite reductase 4Fe-4S region [Thermodesulfatator indicus DSM 15286]|uniref:Nitrite and sulphite reductase 4Fe-4S region n=1 Tax=Thermodesulfatator indicus (strain DSM 15286 / JCM 11887 / CIR29812) TaxID=667014 RepID=F8A9Y7_THEID|nr:4Fe-4S dicluster domain-containing protein [Thermodesulfatator indicus]AEH44190.1 nitrite and sulphite reductase 4Fe-4S region [Thermodesulfatator indicus DSM 15286]